MKDTHLSRSVWFWSNLHLRIQSHWTVLWEYQLEINKCVCFVDLFACERKMRAGNVSFLHFAKYIMKHYTALGKCSFQISTHGGPNAGSDAQQWQGFSVPPKNTWNQSVYNHQSTIQKYIIQFKQRQRGHPQCTHEYKLKHWPCKE